MTPLFTALLHAWLLYLALTSPWLLPPPICFYPVPMAPVQHMEPDLP